MVGAAACLGVVALARPSGQRVAYIDGMKAGRVLAAVAALAVATQGGGVPMCVSLLAETAAPCAMHLPGTHGTKDAGAPGPSSALISYLAPPLAPPPQA